MNYLVLDDQKSETMSFWDIVSPFWMDMGLSESSVSSNLIEYYHHPSHVLIAI